MSYGELIGMQHVFLLLFIIRVGEEVENEENSVEEMSEQPAITLTTNVSGDTTTNGMAEAHPGDKAGVDNMGYAADDANAYHTAGKKPQIYW